MASYALLASESTVQVLSPTLTNDVVYCTIHTQPSGVIASMPVPKLAFDANSAKPELTAFANAIEQIMAAPRVKTVAEVPASLGLKIDFSGGVLAKARNPELAAQFLAYLTSPEAQAVWKAGGVAVPIP